MAIRLSDASTQRVVFDTTVTPQAYNSGEFSYFSVFQPTAAFPASLPIIMTQLVGVSSGRLLWVPFGSTELEVGRTGTNAKATENGAPPIDQFSLNIATFNLTYGCRLYRGFAHRAVEELRYSNFDPGSGTPGVSSATLAVGNAANSPDPFTGLSADVQYIGIIGRCIERGEMEEIRRMWATGFMNVHRFKDMAFFADTDNRDSGGLIIDRCGMASGTITNATYAGVRPPNMVPWPERRALTFMAPAAAAGPDLEVELQPTTYLRRSA